MSLTLYYHPLSSFCWKVLVALYENDTPLQATPRRSRRSGTGRARSREIWPIRKFPVVRDERHRHDSAGVDHHHRVPLIGTIPVALGSSRMMPTRRGRSGYIDRLYDLHLHMHMQKVVGDRLRPEAKRDPHGVEDAKARMRTALNMIDRDMQGAHLGGRR